MQIIAVMAVVTVADVDAAIVWYARLFGRAADSQPMAGLAEWHSAGSGWLQVVRDDDRAGRALLTLGVDDVDAFRDDVASRGITVDDTQQGATTRFAFLTDPEGTRITVAAFSGTDGA